MATIEQRVRELTATVLQVDPAAIRPDDDFTADLGARSAQSVELRARLEDAFAIEVDDDASRSLNSVDGAVALVVKARARQRNT